MPEEGFLRRWARVKASGAEAVAEAPPQAAVSPAAPAAPVPGAGAAGVSAEAAPQRPMPTLLDAARLTADSDFSAFVSPGVAQDVRRLALKKLFADPHFNVPDRLDMYMDDYNAPTPVTAAMLAGLEQARGALRRPEQIQEDLAQLAAGDARAAASDPMALPVEPEAAEAPLARADVAGDEELAAGPDTGASDDSAPTAGASSAIEAPLPAEHGDDAIALTIVRAHNGEARP